MQAGARQAAGEVSEVVGTEGGGKSVVGCGGAMGSPLLGLVCCDSHSSGCGRTAVLAGDGFAAVAAALNRQAPCSC